MLKYAKNNANWFTHCEDAESDIKGSPIKSEPLLVSQQIVLDICK